MAIRCLTDLAEAFRPSLPDTSDEARLGRDFVLRPEDVPDIPAHLDATSLRVKARRRREPYGLIDDLVFEASSMAESSFGLWIACAVLRAEEEVCSLRLDRSEDALHFIRLRRELEAMPFIDNRVLAYRWWPRDLETWLSAPHCHFFDQRPTLNLATELEDDLMPGSLDRRCVIEINGNDFALLRLAEFFLNFGLTDSDLNYETLGRRPGVGILSDLSCDIRVQLVCAEGRRFA
jgi:hypothetical protein